MQSQGTYVCSELVKIGKVSAMLSVYQAYPTYEATWECSCGAKQETPIRGLSIASAAENGKASYQEHCSAAHRD